jgi:hypothetical protein
MACSWVGDASPLVEQLENGETPGNPIQGIAYTVYKARVRNTAAQRGKAVGSESSTMSKQSNE